MKLIGARDAAQRITSELSNEGTGVQEKILGEMAAMVSKMTSQALELEDLKASLHESQAAEKLNLEKIAHLSDEYASMEEKLSATATDATASISAAVINQQQKAVKARHRGGVAMFRLIRKRWRTRNTASIVRTWFTNLQVSQVNDILFATQKVASVDADSVRIRLRNTRAMGLLRSTIALMRWRKVSFTVQDWRQKTVQERLSDLLAARMKASEEAFRAKTGLAPTLIPSLSLTLTLTGSAKGALRTSTGLLKRYVRRMMLVGAMRAVRSWKQLLDDERVAQAMAQIFDNMQGALQSKADVSAVLQRLEATLKLRKTEVEQLQMQLAKRATAPEVDMLHRELAECQARLEEAAKAEGSGDADRARLQHVVGQYDAAVAELRQVQTMMESMRLELQEAHRDFAKLKQRTVMVEAAHEEHSEKVKELEA